MGDGRVKTLTRAIALSGAIVASGWVLPAQLAAQADSGSPRESAVWVPKELNFVYREFTTRYSCDGLQQRMKQILLALGARPDLEVRGYGCTRIAGPDELASVTIRIHVLEPIEKPTSAAGPQSAASVPAHWETVELPPKHDPLGQAADCELIAQVKREVLPLFAARNVDFSASCEPRQLVPGSTRLKAQVLIADQARSGQAHFPTRDSMRRSGTSQMSATAT